MTHQISDALIRRASVLTLGAGLAAVAAPLMADAKKNKGKQIKKKQRQKCQKQVEQCEPVAIAECAGNPDPSCLADLLRCCEFLGSCDFLGFFACLGTVAE
jgi:hypothetical protein